MLHGGKVAELQSCTVAELRLLLAFMINLFYHG